MDRVRKGEKRERERERERERSRRTKNEFKMSADEDWKNDAAKLPIFAKSFDWNCFCRKRVSKMDNFLQFNILRQKDGLFLLKKKLKDVHNHKHYISCFASDKICFLCYLLSGKVSFGQLTKNFALILKAVA